MSLKPVTILFQVDLVTLWLDFQRRVKGDIHEHKFKYEISRGIISRICEEDEKIVMFICRTRSSAAMARPSPRTVSAVNIHDRTCHPTSSITRQNHYSFRHILCRT